MTFLKYFNVVKKKSSKNKNKKLTVFELFSRRGKKNPFFFKNFFTEKNIKWIKSKEMEKKISRLIFATFFGLYENW